MTNEALGPAVPPQRRHPAGTAPTDPQWWRHAVTYQLYIRSFADGNGDGLGDVAGVRARLPHLAALGVDALWINPWYPSPQADAGYDVADYRDVWPTFGTLDEARALIAEAHAHGLRLLLDVVPNHTSDEHAWFRAALAAGPGSPERARYVFRPGRGPGGDAPPTNWTSVFGGPAWERVVEADGTPGEWYLHLFDVRQPDLNWASAEVREEFHDILRFWFDAGVDGFRIDVAHGLVKRADFADLAEQDRILGSPVTADHPYWDRPEVHDVWRGWRAVADGYDPPRVFAAEAWVSSPERLAAYLRPDELHTAFDFDFVRAPWRAERLRETATASLAAHDAVGAPVMWVLSNHDVTRHVTRLGRLGDDDEDPLHPVTPGPVDLMRGWRRARAALMLMLALPGGVYLYQGEELGLEEVEDLPEHLLQDPTWERSGHQVRGRDGCRVPLPWEPHGPSLGFGTGPGWLPQPEHWAGLAASVQAGDPSSMLSFYRTALAARRSHEALRAGHRAGEPGELVWEKPGDDVVAFRRGPHLGCAVNTGTAPVVIEARRVLLASGPVADPVDGRLVLPGDTAVWYEPA